MSRGRLNSGRPFADSLPGVLSVARNLVKSAIARGTIGIGLLRVLNSLLGVGTAALLARLLGPMGYGSYSLIMASVTIVAIPTQCGLPTLVTREVAKYRAQRDWRSLRGLLRMASGIGLGIASVAGALYFVFHWRFHNGLRIAAIAALLVPLSSLNALRAAALQGLRRVVVGNLPETVIRPALLVAALLVCLAGPGIEPGFAIALNVIAVTVAAVVGGVLLKQALPAHMRAIEPVFHRRQWLMSVLPLSVIAGVQVINSQADILLLGVLSSEENVGRYRLATQASSLVVFVLGAINVAAAPAIAQLHALGDFKGLQKLATASSRTALFAGTPVACGLAVFGADILTALGGTDFADAQLPLAILSLGQLAVCAFGPIVTLANMSGAEMDTAKFAGLGALLNLTFNVLLIPRFHATGAAVANTLSICIWKLLLWRRILRTTGVSSSVLGKGSSELLDTVAEQPPAGN